ncbi:hypothetical protein [Salinivibrio kushneri]|uniref:hypothetical protein n=1 Tax=Salinivibrio kushneri TaxID=1908198 RepID=UPI0009898F01|nr:hypothetical protein [Salinivibrio kushneri]OOE71734.1 hypothetical protein BZG19_02140 [Salinivibrio kushneri]
MELFKKYKELFKTYKEAVIAAGSAKHIIQLKSPKRVAYGSIASRDYGFVASREEILRLEDEFGLPFHQIECTFCNPSNYLETLQSFLSSGKRLRAKDIVINDNDIIVVLDEDEDVECWNDPDVDDDKRFILQAAADEHSDPIKEKQKNKIYKTYKEAVIANGSVKGIHCAMISNDGRDGVFGLEKDFSSITRNTLPCYPSGYLQTLADFLESGMSLTKGDLLINTMGQVCSVNHPSAMGMPVEMNKNRYVLDAMAYKSFDELASCSEKPNSLEKSVLVACEGRKLDERIKGYLGELCTIHHRFVNSNGYEMCAIEFDNGYCHCVIKECLETPAEREERECLEAAYSVYRRELSLAGLTVKPYREFLKDSAALIACLMVVDVTGYRKD